VAGYFFKKMMQYAVSVRRLASLILLACLTLCRPNLSAQTPEFARWTDSELILQNGLITRTIRLPAKTGSYYTAEYKPSEGKFNYFAKKSPDFRFSINDTVYSGTGTWTLLAIKPHTDAHGGSGAAVTLRSQDQRVEVTLNYLLYPNLPVVRKSLAVRNTGSTSFALESVDTELFEAALYHTTTFSWICHDYGRRRSIGPYQGDMHDALVVVHDPDSQQGVVLGNEAPGITKHTSVFWEEPTLLTGLTHADGRYPFRKHIAPGEVFETPPVFTMVYNQYKDPATIMNTAVADYVRKYMGIRLSALKEKPIFVYNTWEPFRFALHEQLIRELAKAAADAGMKEFVIDAGWQDRYGDWGIDSTKFPNGLKPVFDYIKSLGMKPGLWVSIGSASPESRVFREHPEWFVRGQDGDFTNLHIAANAASIRSACFGTDWKNYMRDKLKTLVVDYGLEYLKLDLAVVVSPYRFDKDETGCYATDHPFHRDQHESLFTNYERVWELFDELHALNPELFIDCTFETMGGLQLIDYAMLKHAEGNWLSNYVEPDEKTALRIRNMAWWRAPAMPATALVLGNPQMQDKGWERHIQSLAGALPIMLGDPRKLSATDLKKYRRYADWLADMEKRHAIMSFRQDLPGFGEPAEGMWDGFQRINTETGSGGMVGVFRQNAAEAERLVTISYLKPDRRYRVHEALTGKLLLTATGADLAKKGFKVRLSEPYDGKLFEVEVVAE
jgi:alpha-galactosidase